MTKQRVHISITIAADVEPVSVQAEAMGWLAATPSNPEQDVPQGVIDDAAASLAGRLEDSVQLLVHARGGIGRAVEAAVPSLTFGPNGGVEVRVTLVGEADEVGPR